MHYINITFLYSFYFFNRCKGLILLETYSSLSGEALMNCMPKFLNIVKEVTGDPDYSMFNLSLKEDWSITKKFCHSLHGKEKCSHFNQCQWLKKIFGCLEFMPKYLNQKFKSKHLCHNIIDS